MRDSYEERVKRLNELHDHIKIYLDRRFIWCIIIDVFDDNMGLIMSLECDFDGIRFAFIADQFLSKKHFLMFQTVITLAQESINILKDRESELS